MYYNLPFKVNNFLYYIRAGVWFYSLVVVACVCVSAAVFLLLGKDSCSFFHKGLWLSTSVKKFVLAFLEFSPATFLTKSTKDLKIISNRI